MFQYPIIQEYVNIIPRSPPLVNPPNVEADINQEGNPYLNSTSQLLH
ncbi:MAG: hypothetical protein KFF72_06600 [Arthrospira sp. SH-MAG29]|nr:hypothetical protein [Arthrospira sp. SH-MAG29]MBS0016022.1 hypothetical protein [Arthrospira sp. SH-MAG29]